MGRRLNLPRHSSCTNAQNYYRNIGRSHHTYDQNWKAIQQDCNAIFYSFNNNRHLQFTCILRGATFVIRNKYGIILVFKIILVIATIITYIIHIRILNSETEKTLSAGNAESIYVQSIRSKIIHLGRITVILSVTILLLAALLDSGGILIN